MMIRFSARYLPGIFLCIAWLCSPAFAQQSPVEPSKKILILGDSIAVGFGLQPKHTWVSLLKIRLSQQYPAYQVINASANGRTARELSIHAKELISSHQPDIVIIEIGGNDGLRQYSIGSIEGNIGIVIHLAKQKAAQIILLGFRLPLNYPSAYRSDFHDLYQRLQKRHQIVLIDFFFEYIVNRPGMFQGDNIHPTEKAQPVLLETLWSVLKPML